MSNKIFIEKKAENEYLVTLSSNGKVLTSFEKKVAKSDKKFLRSIAGTTRSNIYNMIIGVSSGFERKLILSGIGYRAKIQGKILNLSLGFSHVVGFNIPSDVIIETPTQTEILIKGICKQKVGQAAARIRSIRPLEPYKGKGVRYDNEIIKLKETNKK